MESKEERKRRRSLPESLRRAIRLSISVGIAAATGFSLLGPLGGWHSKWGSQMMMGTKWAAITSVVCNAPVIGKTTEVALERVLGTVAGGVLGYLLDLLNDRLPFLDQPTFTVASATVVAFCSVLLGARLRLDYSGRLFILSLLLVIMAAPNSHDAFVVAVTRISGILFGVLTTMGMSVIVFPKSASHQATDHLTAGLAALAALNATAWRARGSGGNGGLGQGQRPPRLSRHDSDQDSVHLLVDEPSVRGGSAGGDSGGSQCCDAALDSVYARMTAVTEFTRVAKSETYVLTSRGRWCLIPAFKCLPWRTALPEREMGQVVAAARRVARLLWCLHDSMPEATDAAVLNRYHGAAGFLADLGGRLQAFLEQLAACFPNQRSLDAGDLYAFVEGVETLLTASQQASEDSTILLQAGWPLRRPLANGKAPHHAQPEGASESAAEVAPLAHSAPAATLGSQRSQAFICDAASGLVTRVSGTGLGPSAASAAPVNVPGRDSGGEAPEGFSPVWEVLPQGSQTRAVLQAAAEAADADSRCASPSSGSPTSIAAKQRYLSQVRWQATQFLLRRLARELLELNCAFVRLSALLPPTRWESRRRRAEKAAAAGLQQPLLDGSAA